MIFGDLYKLGADGCQPRRVFFSAKKRPLYFLKPDFAILAIFFIKINDFVKTKKNPDAIPVILAVVARPYLCYVSESKGFGCHFMRL